MALLFVAGCATGSGSAQLSVTTGSSALPAGSVSAGGAYPSTALSASGGTAPYTWAVTSGNLPAGLNLSGSGTILGTPTTAGTFPFTVTVTDSATPTPHTSTSSLSITINAVLAVTTSGTLPTTGETGQTYSATMVQTGGVGPFTWSLPSGSTLPAGLNLSAAGVVSGTITSAANTYAFTVKVTDAQGNSIVSGNISIKVDAALVLTPPTFPTGVVGVSYTSPAFTASGGSASGYTFAIASGLAAPLVLGASNGIITGTPTAAGALHFTVKVTDSLGYFVTSGNLTININPAITVSLAPASPVTLDQGKTQLVTATVGNDPASAGVTWSAVTGLGTLTGSTSTTVTYNAPAIVASASTATFTATSVTDPTKSATYTVNLVPPPSITTSSMAAGNVNGAYSAPVNMTGGIAPYTWTIQAGPTGLSLSASTTNSVTVQGTPTVAGNNQTFTIKVTDAQGLSATSSGLTITIYPTLVITPPSLPVGVVGVNFTSPAYTASGGSGSGYTFAVASGSIAPLTIGGSSVIISGTPTVSGTLTFTIKVTDSVNDVATTATQTITVNPAITVALAPASPVSLDQTKTQLVTATVGNDPLSAGVTWSAVTGLGTLTGSTSTTITYNAPAVVASASTATFTATSVTDPTKSATYTVHLVPPPAITTSSMPAGNLNGAYNGTVNVSGGVSPYTWVILAGPSGLSLNGSTSNTVTVQGAPTVAGNGQTFTIKVTDAQGLTNTSSGLTIDVFSQLVLTPPSLPLPTGVQGLNYPTTVTFSASGGSGTGYTWSIVAGNPLPPGLALSAASGTTTSITAGPPTTAGTYPFSVKLTDSVNNTVSTSGLSITINPPIGVTLSPTQPFAMDQNTSQLITATVNNDPASAGVTWSTLTGLGSLSGSTTTTITYNAPASIASTSIATFTATSITDPSKNASFSISLEPPPAIATPTFPDATLNAAYTPSAVTVTGGVAPFTWQGTTLPPGMGLSISTTNIVNLQGTPTSAGAGQTVTIKVTDAKGLFTTVSSTINVVAPSCSSNCTISGVISGPTVAGVNVALSTGPTSKPATTTDSGGNYSFTGLAGGTYTVTPSLAGYTFTPSAPSVTTTNTTTTQNFTEASTVQSFSISGTLTYAGSKTGRTFIRVLSSNCSGNCGGASAATSLVTAPSAGGTTYTVRGLQPGGYIVTAEVDTLNSGASNASNPFGNSTTVNITSSNASGANITLSDPATPTPVAISDVTVAAGNGFGLLQYNNNGGGSLQDNNGREIATSYEIDYGTDPAFTSPAPTVVTFVAHGISDRNYIVQAAPGTYFFRMYALVGATKSAAATAGPVVIRAAGSGASTVSGQVTFPVAATGPLYVGVFNGSTIYGQVIASPTSPASYSFSGVPTGNYQAFAIIDQNNNGLIQPSDVSNVNTNGGPPALTVGSGTTTNNIALISAVSTLSVTTGHQQLNGSNDTYNLNLGIAWGSKRPVAMTLISGPHVPLPWDLAIDPNNTVYWNLNGTAPLVGDTYQFQVTFSDASTQTISTSVTAVLNSFVTGMTAQTTTPGSVTAPQFNWVTPASTPSPYTYYVGLNNVSGSTNVSWNDFGGNNSNGIPSGTTSVLFNADGSAQANGTNISTLPTATNYQWFVGVTDSSGNSSQEATTYNIP
ncbi:MAG: putative Ig domain-containing protein [Acidobacteriia bacterium]|nr:putative Ig domain-containing protein [Terriglobia bacterium]